jgi:hypothetical protein
MNNLPPTLNLTAVKALLDEAKSIAKRYKHLTGRPLGITGEVGEVEAATLLDLELAQVRQSGFDAFRTRRHRSENTDQISLSCQKSKAGPENWLDSVGKGMGHNPACSAK